MAFKDTWNEFTRQKGKACIALNTFIHLASWAMIAHATYMVCSGNAEQADDQSLSENTVDVLLPGGEYIAGSLGTSLSATWFCKGLGDANRSLEAEEGFDPDGTHPYNQFEP